MLGADRLSGKDCVSDADLLSCPRTASLARKRRVARFSCRSHVEGRIASVEPLDTISSRSPSDYYVYGASGVPTEQISVATGTAIYLYTDQLGSVRMEVSATGAVIGSQSYSDYGTVSSTSGTDPTPFGFAGGYTDATGLIYLINRYYDPATGQFVSVDPLVGVTGAAYGYAGGNPVSNVDPHGLCDAPLAGLSGNSLTGTWDLIAYAGVDCGETFSGIPDNNSQFTQFDGPIMGPYGNGEVYTPAAMVGMAGTGYSELVSHGVGSFGVTSDWTHQTFESWMNSLFVGVGMLLYANVWNRNYSSWSSFWNPTNILDMMNIDSPGNHDQTLERVSEYLGSQLRLYDPFYNPLDYAGEADALKWGQDALEYAAAAVEADQADNATAGFIKKSPGCI